MLLAISLVTSSVLHRLLALWAHNAWDLSDPVALLPTILGELAVALALFMLIAWISGKVVMSAILVAAISFLTFNWQSIAGPVAFIIFGVGSVVAVTISMRASSEATRGLALLLILLMVILPAVQLVIAHIDQRTAYPLLQRTASPSALHTGNVEDILILIVDGYPMSAIAHSWFGHESRRLESVLEQNQFTTESVAWSHNTFTSLALPSLLELRQVVDTGARNTWSNQKSNYDILRGNSFTVEALISAGFEYTHIESGWNGDACGMADHCLRASWPDEAAWQLLSTGAFFSLLEDRWGSPNVSNTMSTVQHLIELEVFNDGEKDLVYGHMMLPHSPFTVDEHCELLSAEIREDSEDPALLPDQLDCVDSLLVDVISHISETTAVLIAADHGTATRGQLTRPSDEWTDADIAERLGAFLAYRLPTGCATPPMATNLHTLRAIVQCTIDAPLPTGGTDFVVGIDDPTEIGMDRIVRIGAALHAGSLAGSK